MISDRKVLEMAGKKWIKWGAVFLIGLFLCVRIIIMTITGESKDGFKEVELIVVMNLLGTGYSATDMYEQECSSLYDGSTYYVKSYSYVNNGWLAGYFKWDGAIKDGRLDGEGTVTRYDNEGADRVTKEDGEKGEGFSYTGNFVNGLPDGIFEVSCTYGSHQVSGTQEFDAGRMIGECIFYDEAGQLIEYREIVDEIHTYYMTFQYNERKDVIEIIEYDPPESFDLRELPEKVSRPQNACGIAYSN